MAGRMQLPLFPLHVVAFPHMPLPLHIFEQRYRKMTRDLLRDGNPYDGRFVVAMIAAGREIQPTAEAHLQPVGTICQIRRADRFDDGRWALLVVGVARARLGSVDESGPYAVVDATPLDEVAGPDAGDLIPEVQTALDDYIATMKRFLAEETDEQEQVSRRLDGLIRPIRLPPDPLAASYAVAGVLQIELSRKQRLLELPDAASRLRAELQLLQRESQLLGTSALAPMARFEYHSTDRCQPSRGA